MRTYTWDEYYEKFYDWAESTRVKKLSYLDSLGDSEEVTEVILELRENENASTCLLRRAIEEKMEFSGDDLLNLYIWDYDEELLTQALKNSVNRLTTEDIENLLGTAPDEVLHEVCKQGNIPLSKDLREIFEWDFEEDSYEEDFDEEDLYEENLYEEEIPQMTKSEICEAYDYVLECLYHAHEKLKIAYRLSVADMSSKKRSVSIAKHACVLEAEPFLTEARYVLGELESQVQDTISVRNTRLNMGNRIAFHDIYGDGFLTNWSVQKRIKQMLQAIETAYNEVQLLRNKL